MIILPSLKKFTKERPTRSVMDVQHAIPDDEHHFDFWEDVYRTLFGAPLESNPPHEEYISDEYGYFGERVHPVTREPNYFHMGIECNFNERREVKPLFDGVLEYSGYGVINGHYVLLSHPQIQTEDGYVLHTMYCHLKKPLVKFTSYQKMLREISLNTYPIIEISKNTVLGFSGKSGLTREGGTQLYIQCDFRKDEEDPIVVNPLSFFRDNPHKKNTSSFPSGGEE